MVIVGITGGIGAGKTTLMKLFENKQVPCFYSDEIAKKLIETTARQEVIQQFGGIIVKPNGEIDKNKLSTIVFSNKHQLEKLNAIIHPKIRHAFNEFKHRHQKHWLIAKEAAIMIESESYKECDYLVLVTAPRKIRKQRIMRRSKMTYQMIEARMATQWEDDIKRTYADFEIESTDQYKMKKDFETLYLRLQTLTTA